MWLLEQHAVEGVDKELSYLFCCTIKCQVMKLKCCMQAVCVVVGAPCGGGPGGQIISD